MKYRYCICVKVLKKVLKYFVVEGENDRHVKVKVVFCDPDVKAVCSKSDLLNAIAVLPVRFTWNE